MPQRFVDVVLDSIFRREEMDGCGRCPTYLVRWTLLKWGDRGIYLHHFVGDDWSRDLHDHPKRFISIGLWGAYVEETPGPELEGRWEVVTGRDREMVHVRWSLPNADGVFLWVRHYPNTGWGQVACEGQAQDFNRIGRVPAEWGRWTPAPAPPVQRTWRAPWLRTFPATHIHRIGLVDGRPAWSLVIVLKTVRPWGFWNRGQWIPWRQYVDSELATQRKACAE